MRKILYSLLVTAFFIIIPFISIQTKAQGTDLFFSEYIEGTSNNKAVEIYNPTSSIIDLAGYSVNVYTNGSTTSANPISITLPSNLNPGQVYVICHTSAGSILSPKCNQLSGNLNFNGNDAVALQKDGSTLDITGQIGTDPGSEWGTGATSTLNHTLTRKCSTDSGDPNGSDFFDPSVQWDGFAIDSFTDIGKYNCLVSPTETPTPTPSVLPTEEPIITPTPTPTETPTPTPTPTPSATPTVVPADEPTVTPTPTPSPTPTSTPTTESTLVPSPTPRGDQDNHFHHWLKKVVRDCGKFIHESFGKIHSRGHDEKDVKKWPPPPNISHFYKKHSK
jgi:hypothetical protein